MIKKNPTRTQTDYFQQRFNKSLLPDLDAAGPLSASTIASFADPLKYLTSEEKIQSDDMAYGSAVDMLWLTPELWDKYCIVQPKDVPKKPSPAQINAAAKGTAKQPSLDAIAWWDSFRRRSLGKMVIDHDTFEQVKKARNMLNTHPISRFIFDVSEKQTILEGVSDKIHPDGNPYEVKAMLDLLPQAGSITVNGKELDLKRCVVDLKQCHNVSEHGMKTAIKTFQYHMKMSWYLNVLRASGETQRDTAVLIFQNSRAPLDVHVRVISDEDIEQGRQQYIQRITKMRNTNPKDLASLLDDEVKTLSLPKWMKDNDSAS